MCCCQQGDLTAAAAEGKHLRIVVVVAVTTENNLFCNGHVGGCQWCEGNSAIKFQSNDPMATYFEPFVAGEIGNQLSAASVRLAL